MKPELQRIETTLHQLKESLPSVSQPTSPADSAEESLEWNFQKTDSSPSFSMTVPPIPVGKQAAGKTPVLPKLKPPSFSNHRHGANPGLAMILLQEIEEVVGGWQKELQQVVRQIQDIYLEGPIVDGWLESHAREPEVEIGMLRHVEADRVMDYVEVETGNFASPHQPNANVTCEAPRTGYRLCGLNADGQSWSRLCPPEQVPSVSMAIARYQKLRQLLSRKQDLETRLTQLAETLVVLHSHLSES